MLRRKKHYSIMGMDMDLDRGDIDTIKTAAKTLAAGVIVYQAAKYVLREMMD